MELPGGRGHLEARIEIGKVSVPLSGSRVLLGHPIGRRLRSRNHRFSRRSLPFHSQLLQLQLFRQNLSLLPFELQVQSCLSQFHLCDLKSKAEKSIRCLSLGWSCCSGTSIFCCSICRCFLRRRFGSRLSGHLLCRFFRTHCFRSIVCVQSSIRGQFRIG